MVTYGLFCCYFVIFCANFVQIVKFAFEMIRLKTNTISVTLYLDIRREKANGKFPLKLSVYSQQLNQKKLFPTKLEYTKTEFSAIYDNSRVALKHRKESVELTTYRNSMSKLAESIIPFSFEKFREAVDFGIHDSKDVIVQMQLRYEQAIAQNKHKTNWNTSKNSFIKYQEFRLKCPVDSLKLSDIDSGWLRDYEAYMLKMGRTKTTVGIYTRNLKAIFNKAINDGVLAAELSPFGRYKYVTPKTIKVNKALSLEEYNTFKKLENLTPLEELCRDYWMFSFLCCGMNLIDILMIRPKDINNNILTYVRWKTRNTRRMEITSQSIALNDEAQAIIRKYQNNHPHFIFSIFHGLPPVDGDNMKYTKTHNNRKQDFNKKLNKGLYDISVKLGITTPHITMYWARHSFATLLTQKGHSVETISSVLGHSDIKTTQGYLGRLEIKKIQQIADDLTSLSIS